MLKYDVFNRPPKCFLKQSVLSNDYVSASNFVLLQFHHEAKVDIRYMVSRQHICCTGGKSVCVYSNVYDYAL